MGTGDVARFGGVRGCSCASSDVRCSLFRNWKGANHDGEGIEPAVGRDRTWWEGIQRDGKGSSPRWEESEPAACVLVAACPVAVLVVAALLAADSLGGVVVPPDSAPPAGGLVGVFG